ncbi:MAG: GHKL domain-containing protein [Firmicutes bacterium]|nr:GHKL domain-containing protein [Bacillota bacterium]
MLASKDNGPGEKGEKALVITSWLILVFLVAFTVRQHIVYLRIDGGVPRAVRIKALGISCLAIAVWYYIWQKIEGNIRKLESELECRTAELMHMHEQRHDLLNELTLALMYLQSGHLEKGQQCLHYAASHVSDRVSDQSMPEDAWIQMINLKQKEAMDWGINFHVDLTYAALENPGESHLLARLLGGLLDNALEAAAESRKPFVFVGNRNSPGYRKLVIGNNGATIPLELIEQVRQPGLSTKNDKRGYGLTICERLAQEMGGHLDINSDPHAEWTEVSIVIPMADKVAPEPQEQLVAEEAGVSANGDSVETGLQLTGGR